VARRGGLEEGLTAGVSPPRVSIVLPTWNGARDLARLLPALAAQDFPAGFEIRAVDSGSTDGSADLLKKAGAKLLRIEHADFRHGATRNLAAREATGEILVFLSQDATPRDPTFLSAIASAFEDPSVAAATARILPHPDDDPLTARTVLAAPEAREDPGPASINDVASAIRTSTFRETPFPEVTFGEDVAWSSLARRAGLKIRFEPRAVVFHSHRYTPSAAYRRYRTDAAFRREQFGERVRPSLASVARGIAYEVREDWRYVREHGGFLHLLRSPSLRAAQVLGQYAGSRG
jgi:rhamnosyltransferase